MGWPRTLPLKGGEGWLRGWLFLLSILAGLIPTVINAASAVVVEATLSGNTIRVGDQVTLRVAVTHEPQVRVEVPDLVDKLPGLEVIRKAQATARPAETIQLSTTEIVLTSFTPGQYRLPPILVQYTLPDGTRGSAEAVGDLAVEVTRVVANPELEPLKDIKPPAALARPAAALAQPAAGLALAGSAAFLAFLTARRVMRRPRRVTDLVQDPATRARQSLSQAGGMELRLLGDYVHYYAEISMAVRRYLDARFGFDAAASTTREIERTMEQRGMDRWQARIAGGLLEECDTVKWAHYIPDPARAQRALTNAFEVVELGER